MSIKASFLTFRLLSIPFSFSLLLGFGVGIPAAIAQLIPDGTLGPEPSTVNPTGTVNAQPAIVIEGGAIRGANLFHSFTEFNVGTGQRIYFDHPNTVNYIVGRITGGNPSNIDGTLGVTSNGVTGNADLFLLNPNGIIFGPNASLDLNGSFIASTADSLIFPGNIEFAATNPQIPPLLTINLPVELRFSNNPGDIRVRSYLQGAPSHTLGLVGGNILIDYSYLEAEGGRIELGGVDSNGSVLLRNNPRGWQLEYDNNQLFRDIVLGNDSLVGFSYSALGSADVNLQGRNIDIIEASQIDTSTFGVSDGGRITVSASESLRLSGFLAPPGFPIITSGLISQVNPGIGGITNASGGDIIVTTANLIIEEAAAIANDTYFVGNAGNINIYASESVDIRGSSIPTSGINNPGTNSGISSQSVYDVGLGIPPLLPLGNSGNISIVTRNLRLSDGAAITTTTTQFGNAGNIDIVAIDSIEIAGEGLGPVTPSGIASQTLSFGNAGNITLSTSFLSIGDGGVVSVETQGFGQAGRIFIEASDLLRLVGGDFGSGIFAESFDIGTAGDIQINAGQVVILDGSRIDARATSIGDAGTLVLNVNQDVLVAGSSPNGNLISGIYYDTSNAGNAGDLVVNANNIFLLEGGRISASTSGTGQGGVIEVQARNSILASGSSFNDQRSGFYFDTSGSGDAQGIYISAFNLNLLNGGQLTVDGTGIGSPGDIVVNSQAVTLSRGSSIRATTSAAERVSEKLECRYQLAR